MCDGYGDLCFEYIYFEGGVVDGCIVIFDCIEFNECFCYVDVCVDMVFVVMDFVV